MVKRCSRNIVVLCFVVAMFLIGVQSRSDAQTLDGILQGGTVPLVNATITLTDAITFSVLDTTSSGITGAYSFDVDDGIYHLFITPPAGSNYRGVIISDIRVNGKNVTQHIVLDTRNDSDVNQTLISNRSQLPIETIASNISNASDRGVKKELSASDFLFLLPDCSSGVCE